MADPLASSPLIVLTDVYNKTFEAGQTLVIGTDLHGGTTRVIVRTYDAEGGVLTILVEGGGDALAQAVAPGRFVGDELRLVATPTRRQGGPPPHTVKSYDRRRSAR